jgi:hypothetical protein
MKLLITKFSPLPCYLIPLRLKYSPQHPILKNTQPNMLQKVTLGLRFEHILWDDLHNRKRTQKLEIIISGNLNSSGSLKTVARE